MGSRPRAAVVSLGLRGTEQDRWVYDLYKGMMTLAQRWHLRIAGGDIVRSPKVTTINVTAFGEVANPDGEVDVRRELHGPSEGKS